jgi:hypothetical protein
VSSRASEALSSMPIVLLCSNPARVTCPSTSRTPPDAWPRPAAAACRDVHTVRRPLVQCDPQKLSQTQRIHYSPCNATLALDPGVGFRVHVVPVLLQLVNNIAKFVRQRLCGCMELDQLTGLQMHISSFQIVLDGLAQLISCTDSFAG